ncbi:hypothetical protein CBS9595_003063 [Malassezia furfur]|nr:hypothetical protein CBS9595_003063 [Malassezia furfur]
MIPKTWQGPVLRDLLVSSIRRAPTSHPNNSDSLRRVVLQRNVLAAATGDHEASSSPHTPLRRLSSDFSLAAPVDDLGTSPWSYVDPIDKLLLDGPRPRRSTKSLAAPITGTGLDVSARAELREEAWFDQVMEDLEWSAELDDETPVPSPSPVNPVMHQKQPLLYGPPPVHGNRLYTLSTIPE